MEWIDLEPIHSIIIYVAKSLATDCRLLWFSRSLSTAFKTKDAAV